MFRQIDTFIKTHINPKLEKKIGGEEIPHILVGFSGGPDSMFLLHYLKTLEEKFFLKLSVAHLNHGWRKESDDEEVFCRNVCEKLQIPIFIEHAKNIEKILQAESSTTKKLSGDSKKASPFTEELGRIFRIHFFNKIKKECNADYIALAHHQQDQQETFFIRLIRGCSLSGLTAIKPVQGDFLRPLLKTSKEEILTYLHKNKIEYLTDPTNESCEFLRNRIRKWVIPALKKTDPRFDKKFETSLDALEQEHNLLQNLTQEFFKKTFSKDKGSPFTKVSPFTPENKSIGNKNIFATLDDALQKRVIIKWLCTENVPFSPSTRFLQEIINFLTSDRGGRHQIHKTWSIKKQQKNFWIETIEEGKVSPSTDALKV